MKKLTSLFIALLATVSLFGGKPSEKDKVDLVVFSFNRPMQLYAFLESSEKHLSNLNQVHAVVRSSAEAYTDGYKIVEKRFPSVHIHYQGDHAPHDFKPLLLASAFSKTSKSEYLMFAVDDMIITEETDLLECTRSLAKRKEAWFFSLRLGKNIIFCGRVNKPQSVPKGKKRGNTFMWKFRNDAQVSDWNYPNTTDTTIYRKKDIKQFLHIASYNNPNLLEGIWSKLYPTRKKALCFSHSRAINIPMNVVNPYFSSPNMQISVPGLLDKFLDGEKIDIDAFYRVDNPSPHVDYNPTFIRYK